MIKLSKRLAAVAALVPRDASVIDVGTDHGMLPVWLVQNGCVKRAFGSDIHEEPLKRAEQLVSENGLADRIKLRVCDGLQSFSRSDADCVVMAGMGGETMIHILTEAPWTKEDVVLILQPQTKVSLLRMWLHDNGYSIETETLVKDMGRIYPVFTAKYGQPQMYSPAEYVFGHTEQIAGHPLLDEYADIVLHRMEKALPHDPDAGSLYTEIIQWRERLQMIRVSDVLQCMEEKAPCGLKLDFDNVGHLVGHADAEVSKILVALDITDNVIEEALALGADLIVSHHPLIFHAIKSVTDGTWVGSRIMTLCENHVAAICMHTNLDAAKGGVNDALLTALGAQNAETFDPVTDIGRVGELETECSLGEFLLHTKTALNVSGLRFHDAGKRVKRIACCGGSGGDEIALAVEAGCDTYVTADVKYDQFLEAKHLGINLIDADHFCTENVVVPVIKDWVCSAFPELQVYISQSHKQTSQFI